MERVALVSALVSCLAALPVGGSDPTPGSIAPPETRWLSSAHAKVGCSAKVLKGRWGLTFSGTLLEMLLAFQPGPLSVIAIIDSDGAGSFTGTGTANVSGVVASQSGTGTYIVNPHCTGTGTFHYPGWSMDLSFVITGAGEDLQVSFVNTSQPAVVQGKLTRL